MTVSVRPRRIGYRFFETRYLLGATVHGTIADAAVAGPVIWYMIAKREIARECHRPCCEGAFLRQEGERFHRGLFAVADVIQLIGQPRAAVVEVGFVVVKPV